MGFARVYSRALLGVDSPQVLVEVHISNGLPSLTIVGLPEASVKESRERVRSALLNAGFDMPVQRITVNLAPADLPKSGGRYDLAIAVGILIASNQISLPDGLNGDGSLETFEFFSELALNGNSRAIAGVLPSLLSAQAAGRISVVAWDNAEEVALLQQAWQQIHHMGENSYRPVIVAKDLNAVATALSTDTPDVFTSQEFSAVDYVPTLCLSDIRGQRQAKRVLELCASGGHSLLMVGEPGAGKTMLASRLPGILPKMLPEQALETAAIHSIAGRPRDLEHFFERPFLQPHHTASAVSLIGGGSNPKPGAISLAHNGVLFLDELPEFSRPVLEALREPLENRKVEISRVRQQACFPASFQLVVALNPSPSGYFPDDRKGRCKDTPNEINRYLKKISGPLLDRIDCHLEVPAVDVSELQRADNVEGAEAETSLDVRARVEVCQARQIERQGCLNAFLENKQLQSLNLDETSMQLLKVATEELGLSARAYYRTLRLAQTLADMESTEIQAMHVAEALSYRPSQRFLELV
ncbi:YifB family Mg chelatase-like AAA ATPase [Thiomicrorhabdus indica]|uniref:YifB family Mg chelatase-like AAA ATPase n=1 Tax=Thiomicrorhabdus indica TaxID=2267253 RepID=UPI00102DB48B|nr:YifB family Mg chelatase-like AAA ATPase [Thiomicrorhabdus indica]